MSKISKKLIVSIVAVIYLFTVTAVPAQAQAPGPWYDQNFPQWYTKVYGDQSNPTEIFGERYTAAQVQWVIYGFFSFIIRGAANNNDQALKCLFTGDASTCLQGVFSTIKPLGDAGDKSIISMLFEDRPLSGITYLKDTARKFNLIPEANAQAGPGFGFSALSPIQSFWSLSRNITYSLMVVVILVMAFMIMFRVKISPQVVITVQSALPKIAIALVLITFSYAIAGFLIDLMYVVIGLISLLFSLGRSDPGAASAVFGLLTKGPENLGVFGLIISYLLLLFMTVVILISKLQLLSGILGILLFVVVLIATVFIAIKIIWLIVRAFALVFILTIFAPFQILIGTLSPTMGFTAWLRSFAANLAVFPTVGLLFLMSYLFLFAVIQKYSPSFASTSSKLVTLDATNVVPGWPPLLIPNPQFFDIMFMATSFVIFSIIPSAGNFIKSMIEGKPFAFGTAIGEAVAPAMGLGGAMVGTDVARYESDAKEHRMSTWEWVRTLPPADQLRYLMAAGGRRLLTRR